MSAVRTGHTRRAWRAVRQLRVIVPCLLLGAVLLAGALSYLSSAARARRAVIDQASVQLTHFALGEARDLAHHFRLHNAITVQDQVQDLLMLPGIASANLLAADGLVLASTLPGEIGRRQAAPAIDAPHIEVIGDVMRVTVPIAVQDSQGTLNISRDLAPLIAAQTRQLRVDLVWTGLYFGVLSGLLALYFNFGVAVRLRKLAEGIQQVCAGESLVRLLPGPDDEIGAAVETFNQAATQLDASRALNAQLVYALEQLALPDADLDELSGLARAVALGLGCEIAGLGRLTPDHAEMVLLGSWGGGAPSAGYRYLVADTPCKVVCGQDAPFIIGSKAAAEFPADPTLTALRTERYLGVCLRDQEGTPLGILFALDTRPRAVSDSDLALLRVAAGRAAQILRRLDAEAAMQAKQDELDFALGVGGLAIWRWDVNEGMTLDERWYAMFGFNREQAIHTEDRDALEASFKGHLRGDLASHESEYRLLDGNGHWRRVLEQGKVVSRDADGRALRAIGIHKDVTSRRALEEKLLERTEFLERALRGAADGLWDWDLKTDELYTSPRLQELLGFKPGGAPQTGQDFLRLCHERGRFRSVLDLVPREPTGAEVVTDEVRMQTAEGRWRWFEMRAAVLRDDAGRVTRMTGSIADIEPRKQKEAAQLAAERLLAESIENLDAGLLRLDAGDRVMFCNSRYLELAAIPPGLAVKGMLFRELVSRSLEAYPANLQGRTLEQAINDRMALHRRYDDSLELALPATKQWLLITDRPTGDGGVACLRTDITKVKQAEIALRDQTELLELGMRGSAAGQWRWERADNAITYSARYREVLGYGGRTLPHKTDQFVRTLVHPDDRSLFSTWLAKLTAQNSVELTFAQEVRLLHGSGVWRWYWVRGAVARTADGRVSRIVGSLADVNERKLREVELAEARQHLSDALESLDVGLVMYDAKQRYVLSNGRMQELFGLDEFDLEVGQSVETSFRRHLALHPELLGKTSMDERVDALMAVYAPRGGRQEVQIGGRWFRFQDYPTAGGGVVSLRAEMTDFKYAEQALQESEARLRTILKHAPIGVFLGDREGGLRYGNQVFVDALGAVDTSLPTFDWRQCIHPEDRQRVETACADYVQEPQGELQLEFRILRGAGGVGLVLFRANPIMEHGEVLGFAGTLEDITERRDAEARQRQLQGQLQQAQKMDAIGQLTGGIAHDFNNILAGILGYTTLAQMRPAVQGDVKLQEYLRAVEVAGERARDLVAKMLAFSRTRAQDEETIKPADPAPMLNEVVSLLRAIIPSNKQLIQAIEPDLPLIRMAPVDLHQVVINLAINARDAITGNGVITLSAIAPRRIKGVCASCHGAFDGDFMEIAVKDTGSGISPEHVEHLFEPFFTTKEVGKGTGMGLAVTHGVIHSMQGHLLVDSTPGAGTCFRLLLRPEPSAVPTPLVVCDEPDNAKPMPLLLLVNSEVDLARQQAESLASYGYRVTAFSEAKAALQWTREHHHTCDALVLELHGPGMSPIEFTNQVLALRPYLPVLLCAKPEDRIDPRVATALGIAQVLETPVTPDRLHRILQQILGKADQRHRVI